MRLYGKVLLKFWTGETGVHLRQDPDAQRLALYLMTSPHSHMSGIYVCPVEYMAKEVGLTVEEVREALGRTLASPLVSPFAEYDEDAEVIFVRNFALHQVGATMKRSDNRWKNIVQQLDNLPKTHLISRFIEEYGARYQITPDDLAKPLTKPLTKPLSKPGSGSGTGSGAEGERARIDQDMDQEIDPFDAPPESREDPRPDPSTPDSGDPFEDVPWHNAAHENMVRYIHKRRPDWHPQVVAESCERLVAKYVKRGLPLKAFTESALDYDDDKEPGHRWPRSHGMSALAKWITKDAEEALAKGEINGEPIPEPSNVCDETPEEKAYYEAKRKRRCAEDAERLRQIRIARGEDPDGPPARKARIEDLPAFLANGGKLPPLPKPPPDPDAPLIPDDGDTPWGDDPPQLPPLETPPWGQDGPL